MGKRLKVLNHSSSYVKGQAYAIAFVHPKGEKSYVVKGSLDTVRNHMKNRGGVSMSTLSIFKDGVGRRSSVVRFTGEKEGYKVFGLKRLEGWEISVFRNENRVFLRTLKRIPSRFPEDLTPYFK